jgi:membrane fusion protein (multidrug efflux system)
MKKMDAIFPEKVDIEIVRPPWVVAVSGRVRRIAYLLFVFCLAVGLLTFLAVEWNWIVSARSLQTTEDAYIQADLVPIIAKVPGYVKAMPVQDFQSVERGAILAQLESDDYKAHVAQATSNVNASAAAVTVLGGQIEVQHSLIDQAKASVDVAQADLLRDRLEVRRQQTLLRQGLAGSEQRVEQVVAAEEASAATVRLSQALLRQRQGELQVLKAQEMTAQADLEGKEAALSLAQISLSETRIVAVRAGVISRRLVNPGTYISTGSQLMTLVPLSDVYVIANFKETQVTNIVPGQRAVIEVDTFPGRNIDGVVEAVSPASGSQFSLLPPDNATGNFTKVVQRIPIKVRFKPLVPELMQRLLPGSSVVVTVDTKSLPTLDTHP